MGVERYDRLRLQEFTSFDIERLLKNNADAITEENEHRLDFVERNQAEYSPEIIKEFVESIQNNAAEAVHVISILHHTDDIYSFFANRPLFREDRGK